MESVVLNNRYRLLELVGSGGMAVVYRGVDTLLQRQVAVKVLRESYSGDPAFLARFRREAQAAASLDHPNVVTVYDVGQDGDHHYIVMEYVQGQDLKTLIRQQGQLGVSEALDIAIQISAGVGHAHKSGVIHCDVKPQNVLVTQDGRAMVTDFGIARALSESGLTESDTVWGSPLYFSPEQAAGDPPSPASDVYSIGVVMYEMLAGRPPFQAEKTAALALMHMRDEPTPLAARNPQVPPQLEWIIRKVMAKEPAARYRNAEQLAHVLEEYRKHGEQATGWQPAVPTPAGRAEVDRQPVEPEPEPEPELAPETFVYSDRLMWALAVIAFVLVVGLIPLYSAVYIAWFPPDRPGPSVQPTRTSQPFATLESTPEQVLVPSVLGKSIDEARREAARYGLRLVEEERDEPGVEGGIVLEQDPGPGERVPLGSELTVYVSKMGQAWEMPSVTNYALDEVQDGLESGLGLQVVVAERWSGETKGLVLAQEPELGATVHPGDTVTLTVSGGVDMPIELEVNLADTVILQQAKLTQATFRPGEGIKVTLYWEPLHATSMPYIVFVHVIDADGDLVAQQDVEPSVPTTNWGTSVVEDVHQFKLPGGLPAGTYQVRTGLYRQGQPSIRLPVVDAGLTTAESDSILIAEIEVE
ncbi:MAG: Stk1 family PASTA domain-containing Ser/Thr kinase [Anaerolineae bacterium]|nr:Stk1 family PASTA domain-containing Ser/Thr kinase [Anaerolineae bacterium]